MKKKLLITLLISVSVFNILAKDVNHVHVEENDVRFLVMIINDNVTNVKEGESYGIIWGVKNFGTQTSEVTNVEFYLSHTPSSSLQNARLLLTTGMHSLDPGRSNTVGSSIKIPTGYSDGSSFLIGVAEHKGKKSYSIYELTVETFRPDLVPDLAIFNYFNDGAYHLALDHVPLIYEFDIGNEGNRIVNQSFLGPPIYAELWLSTDTFLDYETDIRLMHGSVYDAIEPGSSFTTGRIPQTINSSRVSAGTYYIFAVVDRENVILEKNEDNNITYPIKLIITEPVFKPKKTTLGSRVIDTEVYPNPTDGLINFSNNQEESKSYSLTDLNGRVIEEGVINSFEKLELNIRTEASGLYYLKIISGDKEIELHKIVKN